ncbi:GAF and ANTAR domain-containing protein [Catellatospora tritici]|uniref:GAF and ANTAR domain-containing protein n=1 Tax=Catellatospora tritici TaxID=2851566 RepID=UPI001C2D4C07|nr:GAF and ANTAR domain-containing protein [Catellatospora tritici]MBV1855890.1 ANTAR domain-containing protein [Catellatospora tritici]
MSAQRRLQLWDLVVTYAEDAQVTVAHVCAATIAVTDTDGAAATVSLSAGLRETMYASAAVAAELAELTWTLGEGPAVDVSEGGPVLVTDLSDAESSARWPVFSPAAVQAGVRAAFALPLQVGAIRLGALTLHRAVPGRLTPTQLADALLLTDTLCALLLDQAAHPRSGSRNRSPEQAARQHPQVHQATGMITVQLGVTPDVALIRLRAYAYAHGRRLHEVAADVVARRLRFEAADSEHP